jgi:glycerol-3-phosphate dehydrogenase
MPITQGVCQMLFDGLPAEQVAEALLNREIRSEF